MMTQKLPWIISAILLALLIIVTFLWMNGIGGTNLTAQRDVIREYCLSDKESDRARCQEELEDLSDMLQQFALDIREVPQAQVQVETAPVGTTTGQ